VLLNLENQGKYLMKDLLQEGRIVQYHIDQAIEEDSEEKPWDGFIHPSHLNWALSPEKQFESHVNKGNWKPAIEAKRRFWLGNLYHDNIQSLLERNFPGFREVRFDCDEIMFHGTTDYVGIHKKMGCVVFEIKSYEELERDRTWGSNMMEKFHRLLSTAGFERNKTYTPSDGGRPQEITHTNRYHLFTDLQIAELQHRLMSREKVLKTPSDSHITQGFTYAWMLDRWRGGFIQLFDEYGYAVKDENGDNVWEFIELPRPDWVCVCYVSKGGLATTEFWYSLKKSEGQKLLKKARRNYKAVLKELRRYQRG
jgi:hypothetical protein